MVALNQFLGGVAIVLAVAAVGVHILAGRPLELFLAPGNWTLTMAIVLAIAAMVGPLRSLAFDALRASALAVLGGAFIHAILPATITHLSNLLALALPLLSASVAGWLICLIHYRGQAAFAACLLAGSFHLAWLKGIAGLQYAGMPTALDDYPLSKTLLLAGWALLGLANFVPSRLNK